ncbi:MAG: PDZ domain-containing protein [Pirellulaceae bacterium]|nr:PDZ domain-containing protein [Pirellulaceae bacterium]
MRSKMVRTLACGLSLALALSSTRALAAPSEWVGKVFQAAVRVEWDSAAGGNKTPRGKEPMAVNWAAGVVVSKDGMVVTTDSGDDGGARVFFKDGSAVKARVTVRDERNGLVLLQLDGDRKTIPLEFPVDSPRVGDAVFMCGFVEKYQALTSGIVSATNVTVDGVGTGLLQTDVALGPGSPSGVLVNEHGKLLGLSQSQAKGLSFSLPSSHIRQLLDVAPGPGGVMLLRRAYLGVRLESENERQCVVASVIPNSPAHKAGISSGDIILAIDGAAVAGGEKLVTMLLGKAAGETISISLRRGEEKTEIDVQLVAHPQPRKPASESKGQIRYYWWDQAGRLVPFTPGQSWQPRANSALRPMTDGPIRPPSWLVRPQSNLTRPLPGAPNPLGQPAPPIFQPVAPFQPSVRSPLSWPQPGTPVGNPPASQSDKHLKRLDQRLDALNERLDKIEQLLRKER